MVLVDGKTLRQVGHELNLRVAGRRVVRDEGRASGAAGAARSHRRRCEHAEDERRGGRGGPDALPGPLGRLGEKRLLRLDVSGRVVRGYIHDCACVE